jgi:hypothetical protein
MEGRRVVMNKLIFNARPIHVDVYLKGATQVLMYTDVDGKGTQVSPTQVPTGAGDPTRFTFDLTFSLVVQEEGADGTDWGQYGRYVILAVLIGVLLFLVLWSGKGKGPSDGDREAKESPDKASRRAHLEEERRSLMAQIKELDRRHEAGELGTGVHNRKRKTLKTRTVEVMRQLEELEGPLAEVETDGDAGDGPGYTGERADLEDEKAEILGRIRDLDRRHDDGEVPDDVWRRKRKHLKAEAVEIMQEIEAMEGEEG